MSENRLAKARRNVVRESPAKYFCAMAVMAVHPVGPEILLQGVEQQAQRLARDRLLADEAERGDIAVVQAVMIVVCVTVGMRVIVAMLVALAGRMLAAVPLLVGGGVEPGARGGTGAARIKTRGPQ